MNGLDMINSLCWVNELISLPNMPCCNELMAYVCKWPPHILEKLFPFPLPVSFSLCLSPPPPCFSWEGLNLCYQQAWHWKHASDGSLRTHARLWLIHWAKCATIRSTDFKFSSCWISYSQNTVLSTTALTLTFFTLHIWNEFAIQFMWCRCCHIQFFTLSSFFLPSYSSQHATFCTLTPWIWSPWLAPRPSPKPSARRWRPSHSPVPPSSTLRCPPRASPSPTIRGSKLMYLEETFTEAIERIWQRQNNHRNYDRSSNNNL